MQQICIAKWVNDNNETVPAACYEETSYRFVNVFASCFRSRP